MDWLRDKLEISHGNNSPLRSMEGLRGVAVFLVFWVHYGALIKPWISGYSIPVSEFIHGFGHLGVDLFFVLSGYLIYGAIIAKNRFSPLGYAKRRIQRIYPTFLAVFLIYIALSFIFPGESKLPAANGARLIYIVQNLLLLPGLFDITPIITVAWSLSYEAFYYLLIPCVIFGLKMKSWPVETRIAFWVLVVAAGFFIYSVMEIPVHLLMFIAGILLFEFYKNKGFTINHGGTLCLQAALAVFGFRAIYEFSYLLSMLTVFILFLVLCLCAFNTRSNSYKWLTYTPLRWLGNMSYSYYLIHGLTLKFLFLVFGYLIPDGFNSGYLYFWLWIPFFAATLLTSFALFISIERPLSLQQPKTETISDKLMRQTAKTAAD
ncbi:MAG TPA: acyltransferase [Gammaproteobacteria bacterium]